MDVHTDIPLKNYVTMRLGGPARFMADIHTVDEIGPLVARAHEQDLPLFVLGGGSNTLVHDEGFDGIVVRNRITGFDVIAETDRDATLKIGAGEIWDDVVKRAVEMGLSGIECLSSIPGTAGAAPVQNIGAYGQEVAETLTELEAYDTRTDTFVTLTNEQCHFAYRYSIFRGDETGRYIITSITLRLFKGTPTPPFYKAVQDALDAAGVTIYTPQTLRDVVAKIRADKLPDPTVHPNTGSFFKNAIVEEWQIGELRTKYPEMPTYDMPDGRYKIPTGWLIEQTGLKGKVLHGMKVHDKNTLVLINESATSYADLASARDEIIGAVRDKFRILIEQEPLEMTA